MSTALERSQNDTEAPGVLLAQCLERILWISAIDGKSVDEEAVRLWCRVASPLLPAESQARIEKLLEGLNSTSEQSSVREFVTFAGTNARVPNTNGDASFDVNPKWSQLLERFTANRDVTDASQPRVGEYPGYTVLFSSGSRWQNLYQHVDWDRSIRSCFWSELAQQPSWHKIVRFRFENRRLSACRLSTLGGP